MNYERLLQELTPDMLPYPWNTYAGAIGIDDLYELSKLAGGKRIYIPKPDGLFKEYIKELVRLEYGRGNKTQEDLAVKYNVSINTIRSYLK